MSFRRLFTSITARFNGKKLHIFLHSFIEEIVLFVRDISLYTQHTLSVLGKYFEYYKGYVVELLMAKRGRYQSSFLNLSVFVLVVSGILAAPHISSYYPTLAQGEVLSSVAPPSATVTELNLEQMSMTTQISDKPQDRVRDYTVKPGDTLSSIAQAHDLSDDTIRWANDLKGSSPILKPGQVLKIPPVTGVVHKVKRGETVYSIAKKYSTDAQNIVNFPFNEYVDLETFSLAVGQMLIVPGGIIEEEQVVPVPRPTAPQYLAKQSLGKFLFPTSGTITQQPVWYHMALDIANRATPDVYAAESGTVVLATCLNWGYGCHIIVDHGNGIQTLYGHLSKYYVSLNQQVGRGDALGHMGSTGKSTGPHLHFEVRLGGKVVNPWPYLK
ncbi:M23 family metallopeptidase [Candidatus Roizmanbacteria bacterium]|nr:M23 family metallopeptidase [Candidatus Roizmanbacteria bacterium]